MMKYECGYITYEKLLNDIWGYGQQLINEVCIDCFSFYVALASGYHTYWYYINNYSI